MKRIDYNGPQPPAHVQEWLRQLGGVTRTGLPKYRLVHAPARLSPSGGKWVEWDDSLTRAERKEGLNTPWRSVIEVRDVPRYPMQHSGWVLERWTPPEDYGSPKQWNLSEIVGGTMRFFAEIAAYVPALGEYPWEGDYEHAEVVFPDEGLTWPSVSTAINLLERGLADLPSSPKARVARAMYNARQAEEATRLADRAHAMDILNETDFAFGGRPFSAGVKRSHSMNHYAKLAGVRSHVR